MVRDMPAIPNLDRFTSFNVEIEGDHSYIHEGRSFRLPVSVAGLAAAAKTAIQIQTPAATSGYIHFRPALFSAKASYMTLTVYESPTFSGGSVATPINANRNSARVSAVVAKTGVAYTSGGIVLDKMSVGTGGNPSSRAGGGGSQALELVFKPSTDYIIVVENPTGGATSDAELLLSWYEEESGV